jgi:hypothetical protein
LGSVVSGIASLRTLSAKILEPSGVLTDQILGAFGPKLKEIELTGEALHSITLDAFEGEQNFRYYCYTMNYLIRIITFYSYKYISYIYSIIGIESQELLLTIRDTNLKELPIGFYKVFKNVVHLSFDLRNNQFETLSADVFYNTSEQSWEQTGTKAIKGTFYILKNYTF